METIAEISRGAQRVRPKDLCPPSLPELRAIPSASFVVLVAIAAGFFLLTVVSASTIPFAASRVTTLDALAAVTRHPWSHGVPGEIVHAAIIAAMLIALAWLWCRTSRWPIQVLILIAAFVAMATHMGGGILVAPLTVPLFPFLLIGAEGETWSDGWAQLQACGVLQLLWVAATVVHPVRSWCLRRRLGCCPHCRYELRGTAGTRCPECGWVAETSTAKLHLRRAATDPRAARRR